MADSRARIWFAAFVLVVFCLGGAGGFLAGRHMPPGGGPGGDFFGGRGRGRFGGPPGGRGGPPALPDLINRLSRDVQLDAAQVDQVKRILEARRDRFERIHRDARDRFEAEQLELHAAIRAVLRPDQQEKFDQFLQRRPPGPR